MKTIFGVYKYVHKYTANVFRWRGAVLIDAAYAFAIFYQHFALNIYLLRLKNIMTLCLK